MTTRRRIGVVPMRSFKELRDDYRLEALADDLQRAAHDAAEAAKSPEQREAERQERLRAREREDRRRMDVEDILFLLTSPDREERERTIGLVRDGILRLKRIIHALPVLCEHCGWFGTLPVPVFHAARIPPPGVLVACPSCRATLVPDEGN